jgi:hypothetical protein
MELRYAMESGDVTRMEKLNELEIEDFFRKYWAWERDIDRKNKQMKEIIDGSKSKTRR